MVQRVVYNSCFGGFGLHENAVEWVRENEDELTEAYDESDVTELAEQTLSGEYFSDGSGPKSDYITVVHDTHLTRTNELLADIVSGRTGYTGTVSGTNSNLRVADVPDSVEWTIDRYDGRERVEEASRTFS